MPFEFDTPVVYNSIEIDAQRKVNIAMQTILEMGMQESAEHKQWVLDQVLRILMSDENYAAFIKAHPEWDWGLTP